MDHDTHLISDTITNDNHQTKEGHSTSKLPTYVEVTQTTGSGCDDGSQTARPTMQNPELFLCNIYPEPENLQDKTLLELKNLYPSVARETLENEVKRRLHKHRGSVRNDVFEAIVIVDMNGLLGVRIPVEASEEIAFLQWLSLTRSNEILEGLDEGPQDMWYEIYADSEIMELP